MTGKKSKDERKNSNMNEKNFEQTPSEQESHDNKQVNFSQDGINPDNEANDSYEKLMAQSKEYFEGWQRERADFLNYKKRIERDQLALKNYLTG